MKVLEVLEAIGGGLNPIAIGKRARKIHDERLMLAGNCLANDLQANQAVRLGAKPGRWTDPICRNDGTKADSRGIRVPGNQDLTDLGLLQSLSEDIRYAPLLRKKPAEVVKKTLVDLGMKKYVVEQFPDDLVRADFERFKKILRTGKEPAVVDRRIILETLRWPLGEKATIGTSRDFYSSTLPADGRLGVT